MTKGWVQIAILLVVVSAGSAKIYSQQINKGRAILRTVNLGVDNYQSDVTPTEPAIITKRSDLGMPESWTDEEAQIVKLDASGGSTKPVTVPAKTVYYRMPSWDEGLISVISDPYTKYTYIYILPGKTAFYISDESDLRACVFGPAGLMIRKSSYKAPTTKEGLAGAIRQFAANFDDKKLVAEDKTQERNVSISLATGVPFKFWTTDGGYSSFSCPPKKIISIDANDEILRLTLLSPSGKNTGTFWVDFKSAKLVRFAIEGLPSTPAPPQQQAPADVVSRAEAILRSLSTHVPELAVERVWPYKNSVSAWYIPANESDDGRNPPHVYVILSSYDSEEEAKHGMELSMRYTQVTPTQKQTYKGHTVYKWDQWGTHRILSQVGQYVVNVEVLKPPAQPVILKVFDNLMQELGPN